MCGRPDEEDEELVAENVMTGPLGGIGSFFADGGAMLTVQDTLTSLDELLPNKTPLGFAIFSK